MRILIVDSSTELQAIASERLLTIPADELDRLDVRVKLSGLDNTLNDLLLKCDVVILGEGIGLQSSSLARTIQSHNPEVPIIQFASDNSYSSELVKSAQRSGIRKVIAPFASSVDILQELISCDNQTRVKNGQSSNSKVVVCASPKGGTGVTSLLAALGEIAAEQSSVFLWDLDADTRDLSRSLNVPGEYGQYVNSWVQNSDTLNRESFGKHIFRPQPGVSIMTPPLGMAESMDFLCHSECQHLVQRVLDFARNTNDHVLVDLGTNWGPTAATILNAADEIVILSNDCPLSVSAIELYVRKVAAVTGSVLNIKIIIAGDVYSAEDLIKDIKLSLKLPESAWNLPALPNCKEAANWPASGKTLYSMGTSSTKMALKNIAYQLGITRDNYFPAVQPKDKIRFHPQLHWKGANGKQNKAVYN